MSVKVVGPTELRQSMSKCLLGPGCPADILKEFKPSQAMERGTLLDQILFGGEDYVCLGSVEMKSGPRKGQRVEPEDWASADAKSFRKAMREEGKVPVLPKELREANAAAEAALRCLGENGIDLEKCQTQVELHWERGGIKKRGTPDIVVQFNDIEADPYWFVIDLKRTGRVDPDWLEKQVWNMKWDVQGSAYREGLVCCEKVQGEYRGHYILAVEQKGDDPQAVLCKLSDVYQACGDERWRQCGHIFAECLLTGEWPGHKGRMLEPPLYAVRSLFGDMREDSSDGLGLVDDESEES